MNRSTHLHRTSQRTKVLFHPCFNDPPVVNPKRRLRKADGIVSLTKYRVCREFKAHLFRKELERLTLTAAPELEKISTDCGLSNVQHLVNELQQQLSYLQANGFMPRLK